MRPFDAPEARRLLAASTTMGLALVVFGASFGVVAVSAGATVLQACALSLFVFTGASQMSAVSVIAAGGSPAGAYAGAALLAARNAVYGVAMSPFISDSRVVRAIGAHMVIDETTAMSLAEEDSGVRRRAFWTSGIVLGTMWNIGTVVGAVIGTSVNPETLGLDAAFPVMFTAMLAPHLRSRAGRMAALFGGVATVVLAPFMPVGLPILVSAFGIVFGIAPDVAVRSRTDIGDRPGTDGVP